jgi:hypothetical protein
VNGFERVKGLIKIGVLGMATGYGKHFGDVALFGGAKRLFGTDIVVGSSGGHNQRAFRGAHTLTDTAPKSNKPGVSIRLIFTSFHSSGATAVETEALRRSLPRRGQGWSFRRPLCRGDR